MYIRRGVPKRTSSTQVFIYMAGSIVTLRRIFILSVCNPFFTSLYTLKILENSEVVSSDVSRIYFLKHVFSEVWRKFESFS